MSKTATLAQPLPARRTRTTGRRALRILERWGRGGARPSGGSGRPSGGRGLGRSLGQAGQPEAEGGAAAGRLVDLEAPLMLRRDAVDDGEAEAGALRFRREIRLEQLPPCVGGDAGAVVGDLERDA